MTGLLFEKPSILRICLRWSGMVGWSVGAGMGMGIVTLALVWFCLLTRLFVSGCVNAERELLGFGVLGDAYWK